MNKYLKLSIDVDKISQEKLFKGKKGTYLNAVIIIRDEPDEYGRVGLVVEERKLGEKEGKIIGNIEPIKRSK